MSRNVALGIVIVLLLGTAVAFSQPKAKSGCAALPAHAALRDALQAVM